MNRKSILILILITLTPITLVIGQPNQVAGFWGVENVQIGDREVTPVAKWFRINQDGTYQSGNGWLQNSEGMWEYDEQNQTYAPTAKNGLIDEFGAFFVQFEDGKMMWQREEEGMNVMVTLSRIDELPKTPADLVHGLWDLEQILENGNDITADFDNENRYYLFIRWDRLYTERTADGERTSGYWHMDAHHPEMTLMSNQEGKKPESWNVKVNNSKLILSGLSDSNRDREMHLIRLQKFPN